jgi:hypothetical protein
MLRLVRGGVLPLRGEEKMLGFGNDFGSPLRAGEIGDNV